MVSGCTYLVRQRRRRTHGSSDQVQLDVLHEDLLVEFVFLDEHVGRSMRLLISVKVVDLLITEVYLDSRTDDWRISLF